jgi:hypothetical protein
MFDAVIDPQTGKPYSFVGEASDSGGLNTWQRQPGLNTAPDGTMTDWTGGTAPSFSDEFLQSIGYGGPTMRDPNAQGQGEYYGQDQTQLSPEFNQWMKDKGYSLGIAGLNGGDTSRLQTFDANGRPVGIENQYDANSDPRFGAAIAAATLFAGGAAAGLYGGAGGAGTGAGAGAAGISPESLAYGALENGAAYGGGYGPSMVASSEAGFGGALGAEAGAEGLGAANGMWDLPGGFSGSGVGGNGAFLGEAAWTPTAGGGAMPGGFGASSWIPGISNQQALGAAGGLVNAGIGSYTAGKALDAQKNATNDANALQKYMYDQNRADWALYRQAGVSAIGGIQNLLKSPESVMNDPGVKFQQQQGELAMNRQAGARGGVFSGAQLKRASERNTEFAGTQLDRNVAQLGATGTQATGIGGMNYANQAGQNTTGLGNAAAGASFYNGNTWQNALNGGIAAWNQSQYKKDPHGG